MVEYWFPTPIWFFDLDEIDNKKIVKYATKLSKKNEGRILSNYGGWQSNDFHLNDCENEELLKLGQIVELKAREAAVELGIKPNMQVFMSNFWLNLNRKGNGNMRHMHPTSFFSAAYYVQVSENCGKIVFEHPTSMANFWWNSFTNTSTYATHSTINYEPKVGRLLIFPSWLEHSVQPNASDDVRISVAFNTDIDLV